MKEELLIFSLSFRNLYVLKELAPSIMGLPDVIGPCPSVTLDKLSTYIIVKFHIIQTNISNDSYFHLLCQ